MKQSLQLRLGQHLTMTPQLQQAIRLLQLSTMELQTEVQDALDSNLMLEEAAGDDTDDGDERGANGAEYTANDAASADAGGNDDGFSEALGAEDSDLDMEPAGIPQDLPVDSAWEDVYDLGTPNASAAPETEYENRGASGTSLREHLSWQLMLTPMSEADRTIATAILDAIDDNGFLTETLEEIRDSVGGAEPVELDEVEAVLHRVQAFDPAGVGARDLRECLLLQLRQLPCQDALCARAVEVVEDHFDLLAARDTNALGRQMKLGSGELQQVLAVVQGLDPRPGRQLADDAPEYVIPDVYVKKQHGRWHVELNPEAVPRVRINPYYASLVRRADSSADNTTLRSHLQEARWFMKSLQSRSETLLKVATAIVERQQGFLEYGEEAMKPMVLHDVAETVEMHESTISRVTSRKYMHTPRGIFELKYFFSSHLATDAGGEASSTAIRALIKKLVAAENPAKPLSDSKLAAILSDQGIRVARRTVAKYREAMAISSSNERKRLT
ncbi:MAG: RNA polymerase factor sigma-54 [Gammaproteobacteria bacterium]|nr:RNA polymerase factor sigma-54 [Gammaproteobacteria bacterium]